MANTRLNCLLAILEGTAENVEYYTQDGIDRLYQLMVSSDVLDPAYARGVHRLRRMCRATGCAPSSCHLSQKVTDISDQPISRLAFFDVWTGHVNGLRVTIKAPHMHGSRINAIKMAYLHELVLWRCLRHPNIVPFIGTCNKFEVSFVSEWMPGGTVTAFLSLHPNHDRSIFIANIIDGLSFMHKLDMVHGDIKPDNVLIDSDAKARLADFGQAAFLHITSAAPTDVTPPATNSVRYMAPELLDHVRRNFGPEKHAPEKPSKASDVYALAVTIWQIYSGETPFVDVNGDLDISKRILSGARPVRNINMVAMGLDDVLWDRTTEWWHQKPDRRPLLLHMDIANEHSARTQPTVQQVSGRKGWRSGINFRLPSLPKKGKPSRVVPVNRPPHRQEECAQPAQVFDVTSPLWRRRKHDFGWSATHDLGCLFDIALVQSLRCDFLTECAQISPSGTHLACTDGHRAVHVFDVATGVMICQLFNESIVSCICFAIDGSSLITGDQDSRIRVWNLAAQEVVQTLDHGQSQEISCLKVSRDGRFVVSGSDGGMICVWKMPFEATPTPIFQVQRPTSIKSVAISPDAHWVVAPGVGRGIIVWDIAAGKQLGDLTGHCGISRSIEFTADGAGLLCISEDKALKYWDMSAFTNHDKPGVVHHLMLANTDEVRSMAISADGFWIVSCSSDGGICFWEKSSTKPQFILYGHQSKSVNCISLPISSVTSHDDRHLFASSGDDGTIKVWSYRAQ